MQCRSLNIFFIWVMCRYDIWFIDLLISLDHFIIS
jgi:hypothetical protein